MIRTMFALLLLIGVPFAPSLARAQSATTGAIAGVVRDTTGAVLPGVTVEASSPALIEKVRVATTDDQGNYKIIDLRPGTYSVTFTLPGFSTFKRDGIELTTGFTATANAEMRVGALEETVTVTGATPVVDIQNVRAQNVMSRELLDTLPAPKTMNGFATLTLGASIQTTTGGVQLIDIGGSKGDGSASLSIHGMRTFDQRHLYDGMATNNLAIGGGRRQFQFNQVGIQENVLLTAVGSAEIETSGMVLNAVPRDGGNTFKVYFLGAYTNEDLQSNNLTDDLRSRGVTSVQKVKQIYDWGLGVGGPLIRDELWFYSANRWWGSPEYQANVFYNRSTSPLSYVADPTRRGFVDVHAWDIGLRLTWQAAAKHKITVSDNVQRACFCPSSLSANQAPESAIQIHYGPMHLAQATWSNPASNRLLFDAGVSYGYYPGDYSWDQPFPGAIGIQELSTGFTYAGGGPGGSCCTGKPGHIRHDPLSQRLSVSYVIGSHAFKAGEILLEGFDSALQDVPQQLTYLFRNGLPSQLVQWAYPVYAEARLRNLALYAQDQWTVKRLTLNLGVRFDQFTGWVPAGTRPAGRFIPAFDYNRVEDLPNFKDVVPRLGAAYDLFGNGKTAIKVGIGRYVGGAGTELAYANHPAANVALTSTRTWNDANGNFEPDCNLSAFTANGECGPLTNRLFGQPLRNTFYADSALKGWGNRAYSWQGTISLQQELRPGVAANVSYFRTQYGNHTVSKNELVTPADFNSYCITAPSDLRLPGGGGNRICGLYDVTPARFGQVRTLVTDAAQFGEQTETFNGVDIGVNARFGGGAFVQGGVSVGRQTVDYCFWNDRPDIAAFDFTTQTSFSAATIAAPRASAYCHVTPPWSAGTQYKVNGSYPLPWGIEPSFTFQNLPGAPISAVYNAPNSAIVPALGRNLAACPAAGTCTATAGVGLIPPYTMFLDRITLLDLRFAKVVPIGGARVKGNFDVYNVFNSNTILDVVRTYGSAWRRPTSIVGGRLFKFSVQLDL